MKMGKKILVVDDSSLMRGFAKSSLKQLKLNNVTEAKMELKPWQSSRKKSMI